MLNLTAIHIPIHAFPLMKTFCYRKKILPLLSCSSSHQLHIQSVASEWVSMCVYSLEALRTLAVSSYNTLTCLFSVCTRMCACLPLGRASPPNEFFFLIFS